MAILLRMLLAHILGDFVFQPTVLVKMKRSGWGGLILHSAVVSLATALLLWNQMRYWWLWVLVLGVFHTFVDQYRTFFGTGERWGIIYFVGDQIVHLMSMIVVAWVAAGWRLGDLAVLFSSAATQEERWLAYVTAVVVLLWSVPIWEAEVLRTMVGRQGGSKKWTQVSNWSRLYGGIERMLGLGLILGGLMCLAPAAFLLRPLLDRDEWKDRASRPFLVARIAVSAVSTILVGLALRAVPLPALPFLSGFSPG